MASCGPLLGSRTWRGEAELAADQLLDRAALGSSHSLQEREVPARDAQVKDVFKAIH